jgi:methanogenic corrinoid protein MtbC1
MSARRVHLELIAPTLREIGDRWQQGTLSVGQEHVATAVASRLVVRLAPLLARRGSSRGSLVLAGAPREQHTLPMVMLADLLRSDGWDVVELGPDTPIDDLVRVVAEVDRLVAVGIQVGSDSTAQPAARAVRALHRASPGTPVLVGGPGAPDARTAARLGADGWGKDANEVSAVLEQLRR